MNPRELQQVIPLPHDVRPHLLAHPAFTSPSREVTRSSLFRSIRRRPEALTTLPVVLGPRSNHAAASKVRSLTAPIALLLPRAAPRLSAPTSPTSTSRL